MTRPTASLPDVETGGAARPTCTACPLVCDDIRVVAGRVEAACDHGRRAIAAALADGRTGREPEARDGGVPLDRQAAIGRAAALLRSARRVLVTGLAEAPLEAAAAACDVAEALGAAVDFGQADVAIAAGPTIARVGRVTADWEELRDRADLVIFWHCDPSGTHPRFLERFVAPPTADGRSRRTISVGTGPVPVAAASHRHLSLPAAQSAEMARCLELLLRGGSPPAFGDALLVAACRSVHDAVREAGCVAIVTSSGGDSVGLEPWSITHLVRAIAHGTPAFEIPLGAGLAGAAALCTWRYGAAGAIARADRTGGEFLPAECDARRLVTRGEVDAVLLLGSPRGSLETALDGRDDSMAVVRICAGPLTEDLPTSSPRHPRGIRIRCAATMAAGGTMLREDGRTVPVVPTAASALPSMHDLLLELHAAVRNGAPP